MSTDYQEPLHNIMLAGEHLHGERIFCTIMKNLSLYSSPCHQYSYYVLLNCLDQLVKFLVTSQVDIDTDLEPFYDGVSKQIYCLMFS